jgi:hypothetical protein
MKHYILTLLAALCLMNQATAADTAGTYRHAVLFKFKDSATPEQVKEVETAFHALPSKIDTIKGYEWGLNTSPENKNDGFTHLFFVSFADKAGLEVYIPHQAHQDFVKILRPILDKVLVFDYVAAAK